jgi:hypothetical protein
MAHIPICVARWLPQSLKAKSTFTELIGRDVPVMIERLTNAAATIVMSSWQDVKLLAGELLVHGGLGEAEILELLDERQPQWVGFA